jgi:uncharacterized membrane protein
VILELGVWWVKFKIKIFTIFIFLLNVLEVSSTVFGIAIMETFNISSERGKEVLIVESAKFTKDKVGTY